MVSTHLIRINHIMRRKKIIAKAWKVKGSLEKERRKEKREKGRKFVI